MVNVSTSLTLSKGSSSHSSFQWRNLVCVRFCCTGASGKLGVTLAPTWSDCTTALSKANLCGAPLISTDSHRSQGSLLPVCAMQIDSSQQVWLWEPRWCTRLTGIYCCLTPADRLPLYHLQRNLFLQTQNTNMLADTNFITTPCPVWQPGPWVPTTWESCQELDGDGCLQAASTP